ncbi:hypothetical protein [Pararhizobium qamdonense]|uniref:hypothetical protein n=1 Tax=Pararhizobium qamdonense TaxID=3031126 RepID=UPI0023E123DA|nr:hypothetical protein [Pararhizobium qamdonense]
MPSINEAIIELLHEIGATTAKPVSCFDIGVPLVAKGFTEMEVLNGLLRLQGEGLFDFVGGNRLRLVKALPDEQTA